MRGYVLKNKAKLSPRVSFSQREKVAAEQPDEGLRC